MHPEMQQGGGGTRPIDVHRVHPRSLLLAQITSKANGRALRPRARVRPCAVCPLSPRAMDTGPPVARRPIAEPTLRPDLPHRALIECVWIG